MYSLFAIFVMHFLLLSAFIEKRERQTKRGKRPMDKMDKEAFDAVWVINDKIINRYWNDAEVSNEVSKRMEETFYFYLLEFMSNGENCTIEYMGIQIWNSEDDQREYDDEKDDYVESIQSYVKKEMKNILSDAQLINKYLLKED